MKHKSLLILSGTALTLFFILTAFSGNKQPNPDDELQHNETNIRKGDAKLVYADITLPAGVLKISSGTEEINLFEGKFTYDKSIWEPVISYEEADETGNLRVTSERDHVSIDDKADYVWNIKLNEDVNFDLSLNFGAGKGDLDLSQMNLRDLDISLGAGEYYLDLAGSSLSSFDFNAGAGEAVIDLGGECNNSLNADLNCGFGKITIKLPSKVGVRVEVRGLLGDIDYNDLIKINRNRYQNEHFGKSSTNLNIDINGGIGEVNLVTVP